MYLIYFPVYRTIYDALSAVPIFLVWMYLSWAVILFGAVVTASLADWRGGGPANRGYGLRRYERMKAQKEY